MKTLPRVLAVAGILFCCLTLAAAACRGGSVIFLRSRQVNPPGTMVMPSQAAFFSAAGGTIVVEVRTAQGLPVPLVDSNGVSWPFVTVTLPAATAVGLGWEITQTSPDSTHPLKAIAPSSGQYSFVVKMNCTATESPVGTYDSSAGAGNGIATGYPAPTSSTPTTLSSGSLYQIAAGSVITSLVAGPLTLVGGATATAAQAASSGGDTPWTNSGAAITTAVTVDASPGSFYAFSATNTSLATTYYIEFFNTTSPTLGTTPPIWFAAVPPGPSGTVDKWSVPHAFGTALSVAFVTAIGGSTAAPASTCWASVGYK